jgi:hypothetical protein
VPASGFVIGFNKIGTHWEPLVNRFLNEENMTPGWTWGSFNGSMDEPIVFPTGRTIRDLEAMIFKGD